MTERDDTEGGRAGLQPVRRVRTGPPGPDGGPDPQAPFPESCPGAIARSREGAGRGPEQGTATFGWTVRESPIGPLLLAAGPAGLVCVEFHAEAAGVPRRVARLAARLGATPRPWTGGPADAAPGDGQDGVLGAAVRQVDAYFAGELREFTLPLDWSLASAFHSKVLRTLAATVAYGRVVGYGELAERVGEPGGARAVGAAMGANPLPVVVPCHRVVESDGGIGGFGGGLEAKRVLLALEGVLPPPLFS